MNDAKSFTVRLHGPFRVLTPDGVPVDFAARSAAVVVAWLALRRGRPATRSEIASEIWPDADPEAARTSLRTALHRVRKAIGNVEILAGDGERLVLDQRLMETDLDTANHLHRRYLLSPAEPDSVVALAEEWEIRRRPLLEGWNDEWVLPIRLAADFAAAELGRELARAAEAAGNPELALRSWHQLLVSSAEDVDAVKQTVRLEEELHGRDEAVRIAEQLAQNLPSAAPAEVRTYLAAVRSGAIEAVPKPEILRSRSEILLLARMFESNLRANGDEALSLLLKEARQEANSHPRTAFSLVQLGLSQTNGTSPLRVQLAILAATIGSWVAEYELGQRWAKFALENLPTDSAEYVATLSTHGFMFLEQRRHEEAEATLTHAIELAQGPALLRERLMAKNGLAGVYLQTLRFDEAVLLYRTIAEEAVEGDAPNKTAALAATHSNISLIRTIQGRWEEAIEEGEIAMASTEELPIYRWLTAPHLGVSRYKLGQREAGILSVRTGVMNTAREKLLRYNQIALDFAAVIFALESDPEMARSVIDVATLYRAAIGHHRSPTERFVLESMAGMSETLGPALDNRLAGQSVMTLNSWVCDALDQLIR